MFGRFPVAGWRTRGRRVIGGRGDWRAQKGGTDVPSSFHSRLTTISSYLRPNKNLTNLAYDALALGLLLPVFDVTDLQRRVSRARETGTLERGGKRRERPHRQAFSLIPRDSASRAKQTRRFPLADYSPLILGLPRRSMTTAVSRPRVIGRRMTAGYSNERIYELGLSLRLRTVGRDRLRAVYSRFDDVRRNRARKAREIRRQCVYHARRHITGVCQWFFSGAASGNLPPVELSS